jgi:hypothetical protein
MNIDRTLAALARQMNYLANTAMGDLSKDEADLFHTACDNINQLMESRDRANKEILPPCRRACIREPIRGQWD